MELALQELALPAATEPLAAGANDPYKMVQVHDYKSLSFFRQSPVVKSASTETIRVFAQNYPSCSARSSSSTCPPSWASCTA